MTTVPIAAPPPPPTEPSGPDSGWREPTSRLPLRWGSYRVRYRLGATLLVGGAVAAFWRAWIDAWYYYPLNFDRLLYRPFVSFVVVGLVIAAGVVIMPARSGRRWLALGLLLAVYVCFGFVEGFVYSFYDNFGAAHIVLGVAGPLAWLVLRERSGPAYAVGLPLGPIAVFVLTWLRGNAPLPDLDYHGWIYTAVPLLAVCGVAWLVRALEPRFGARGELARTTAQAQRSQLGAASEAEAIAAQVRTMAALQAAWDKEHPGQPMPAIAVAPTAAPSGGSNVLAVLALVFGLLGGGLVAVVLGHLARGQIRRTGERGDGMAIAGLVLGYLGLAVVLVYLVAVAGVLASLS